MKEQTEAIGHHTGALSHHTGALSHHTGALSHHSGALSHHTGALSHHTGAGPTDSLLATGHNPDVLPVPPPGGPALCCRWAG